MNKPTQYPFIGNEKLLDLIRPDLEGHYIQSALDIERWFRTTNQEVNNNQQVIATFIIDLQGNLRINDRHSEHVVCAVGKPVLSAGEITFTFSKHNTIIISQISNQSTGYCPSPTSWNVVQNALEKIGIDFPTYFTTAFEFRICQNCGWINIIKDDYFFCENINCLCELPV
jgi:hypothetical protein